LTPKRCDFAVFDVKSRHYIGGSLKEVKAQKDKTFSARVSRAEAVQRFLDTTISLLGAKPISDISIQEIADATGLNHGYVFRYFGTRLDLFEAVTIEIAKRAREQIETEAEKRKAKSGDFVSMDMSLIAVGQELTKLRMRVVMYLISCGVDASKFGHESKQNILLFADYCESLGMSRRMAEAIAVRSSALIFTNNFMSAAFGLTEQDVQDGLNLSLHEIGRATEIQNALGWDV
jgi:AcrR family transcriptional regulator